MDFLIEVEHQGLEMRAVSGEIDFKTVGAGIEEGDQEGALGIGGSGARFVGFLVDERHGSAGERLLGGVGNLSTYRTAGGLRV